MHPSTCRVVPLRRAPPATTLSTEHLAVGGGGVVTGSVPPPQMNGHSNPNDRNLVNRILGAPPPPAIWLSSLQGNSKLTHKSLKAFQCELRVGTTLFSGSPRNNLPTESSSSLAWCPSRSPLARVVFIYLTFFPFHFTHQSVSVFIFLFLPAP